MDTKRGRGKGKKLAMTDVNLRIPVSVLEYYRQFPTYTAEIRRVLTEHAEARKETKPA